MKVGSLILLFGVLALPGGASLAQGNFLLLCRGPLSYATGTGGNTTVVFFGKNPTNSGNGGASLLPGKCAWTDRPVSAAEPTKIHWLPESTAKVRASLIAFASCAGLSTCVAEFLAHNANTAANPHFRIDDAYIRIRPAVFP